MWRGMVPHFCKGHRPFLLKKNVMFVLLTGSSGVKDKSRRAFLSWCPGFVDVVLIFLSVFVTACNCFIVESAMFVLFIL